MKNKTLIILLIAFAGIGIAQTSINKNLGKQNLSQKNKSDWTKSPFEQKVFIENKGQYDNPQNTTKDNKVYYGTRTNGIDVYFSATGITYKYSGIEKPSDNERNKMMNDEKETEAEKSGKIKMYSLEIEWVGAETNANINSNGTQDFYYTYCDKLNSLNTIKSSCYKKIVYKNLYQNIDLEYTLPENGGVKYNLILHPGSDIGIVKMRYKNAKELKINSEGNLIITSEFGDFIDHAPLSFYEDGGRIQSSFELNGNSVSFKLNNDSKLINHVNRKTNKQSIIIDPWISNPTFSINKAFDINYDLAGNVYVYGSCNPFQLAKFDKSGVLKWIYSTNEFSTISLTPPYYGDFTVDPYTGTSYVLSGAQYSLILKINTLGIRKGYFTGGDLGYGSGGKMNELWRCEYSMCTNKIIIAGGGTGSYTVGNSGVANQAVLLDTNLITITPINVTGISQPNDDMALLTTDPDGKHCYMASVRMNASPFNNNIIYKCPLTTLIPTVYAKPNRHSFEEINNMQYYVIGNQSLPSNGFNGMACGSKYLYTYDGSILRKWNKTTGNFIDSLITGGKMFASGGLAVDVCNNVYSGVGNKVIAYDSALVQIAVYNLPDTCFDLKLGPNNNLYVCGKNFVSEIAVTANTPPTTTTTVANNCCNGTATANYSCGNFSTLQYLWSPGGQTTQSATGLCPGIYSVTITNNCTPYYIGSATVADLGNISAAATISTCAQLGSATVSVTGSTGVLTYNWSNGQSTQTASGLTGGIYSVTVTDNTGLCAFTTVEIKTLSLSVTNTNLSCLNTTDGSGTVTVTGNIGAVSYSWSTGATTASTTGLGAGTYSITVTDINNCSETQTLLINSPDSIIKDIFSFPTCRTNDGWAFATVNSNSYSYTWSSGSTGVDFSGYIMDTILVAGTNTLTIYDSISGCTESKTFFVDAALANTSTWTKATSCIGIPDGIATIINSDGVPPFTYSWSTAQTTDTIKGLSAGIYTITLTDAFGCQTTSTVNISDPPPITINSIVNNATCANPIGSAIATGSGGTGILTYNWSVAGAAGQTISGLSAGNYSITIVDANGCTNSFSIPVGNNSDTATIVSLLNVSCSGGANGSATLSLVGGTPPFTYSWSNGTTFSSAVNLSAASYTVSITDSKGCSATSAVTITQPTAISINPISSATATCGKNNGSVVATAIGGTSTLTYTWNNGATTSAISNLSSGNYTLTVFDVNGCSSSSTVAISDTPVGIATVNSLLNVSCNGGNNGNATLMFLGGTPIYTYSWSNGSTSPTVTNISASSYSATITDNKGCSVTTIVTITEPPTLIINPIIAIDASCGKNNGSVDATSNGGVSAHTYSWSNGATTSMVSNLGSGNYILTVTDANGCSKTSSTTLLATSTISLQVKATDVTCSGSSNGTMKVIVAGGSPIYSYSWSTGSVNDSLVNLAVGTYTVTVKDAAGCISTTSISITVANLPPIVDFNYTPAKPIIGSSVNFTNLSTSGSTLFWNFDNPSSGNNNTSTLGNPTHTFNELTQYCIKLIATSPAGCSDSTTKCFTLNPSDSLFIPNVFSPNGDGVNDLFIVFTSGMKIFSFEIYDRWGLKLNASSLPKIEWNGITNQGLQAPDGTYYFVYNGESFNGKHYEGGGFFQLLR